MRELEETEAFVTNILYTRRQTPGRLSPHTAGYDESSEHLLFVREMQRLLKSYTCMSSVKRLPRQSRNIMIHRIASPRWQQHTTQYRPRKRSRSKFRESEFFRWVLGLNITRLCQEGVTTIRRKMSFAELTWVKESRGLGYSSLHSYTDVSAYKVRCGGEYVKYLSCIEHVVA